ncbi:MAG: hypothetical protein IH840_01845 [Candidatus Heimdallarchaeota archaeon]|nr:hypothetical protein [Candidatus Heimdallarchaeota archaeon]
MIEEKIEGTQLIITERDILHNRSEDWGDSSPILDEIEIDQTEITTPEIETSVDIKPMKFYLEAILIELVFKNVEIQPFPDFTSIPFEELKKIVYNFVLENDNALTSEIIEGLHYEPDEVLKALYELKEEGRLKKPDE